MLERGQVFAAYHHKQGEEAGYSYVLSQIMKKLSFAKKIYSNFKSVLTRYDSCDTICVSKQYTYETDAYKAFITGEDHYESGF